MVFHLVVDQGIGLPNLFSLKITMFSLDLQFIAVENVLYFGVVTTDIETVAGIKLLMSPL